MSFLELTPEEHLQRAVDSLQEEFRGVFGRETIDRFTRETYDGLAATFRVHDHLPLFAFRFSRERLQALAQAEGLVGKDRPEVLFVCVHNAGRSQMAAALTQARSGGRVHVRSAGSTPTDQINPVVAQAMAEVGLDLGEAFPKPLTDEVVRAADVVVTMGCGDACPLYPGRRYLDWEVEDPAGADLPTARRIRDDITARVDHLLTELGALSRAEVRGGGRGAGGGGSPGLPRSEAGGSGHCRRFAPGWAERLTRAGRAAGDRCRSPSYRQSTMNDAAAIRPGVAR